MTEIDNVRRWRPEQPGVYEVWYTTWNHPKTDQGFWLRFITEAPKTGTAGSPPYGDAPRGELWFARFDPTRPDKTFGIHKRFKSEDVSSATDPFSVIISGCHMGHDHSFGELAGGGHDVRWDLRWVPAASTLRPLPDLMYARGGLGDTRYHVPNPRVPLSGTLLVDGEELVFERAIAGQSHVWGTKHAYSWTWGRCGEFTGAPDAVLEILGARLQRRGLTLPPMMCVALDLDGEQHRLNQFRHVPFNRGSWGTGRATFSAWSPRVKIEGELTCSPDQMVNAPYVDPDGTELYCANTMIGDARLTIWKRDGTKWREHRRLEARRRAQFEIGTRVRDAVVTRPHVLVT